MSISGMESQRLIDEAVSLRERALTPAQLERRRVVEARNAVIQAGVGAPASGTFGRPSK